MVWRQRPKCLGHLKSSIKAESLSLDPSSQHVAQPTAAATTADTADAISQKDWVHKKIVVFCIFLFPTPDWSCGRCLSKQGMNGGFLDPGVLTILKSLLYDHQGRWRGERPVHDDQRSRRRPANTGRPQKECIQDVRVVH